MEIEVLENEFVIALRELRQALVSRRRDIAKEAQGQRMGRSQESDAGSAWGPDFLEVQTQIEAVDRAIADEAGEDLPVSAIVL
ncbi:hypothetical protein [Dongia sp.]|uniref:hypothetical protein n=1 Tax=Dongia sp. TaxID=1977262 RepID=UPI0035B2B9FE